jgi:2-amino-4-hydroxy-6-hydroxymethyldihydropteridine diphosphokinase
MTDTVGAEAQAHEAWLGLGSNLGDRGRNLARAIEGIEHAGETLGVSGVFESAPVGYTDQPVFWNMAARLRTRLEPHALLRDLKALEARLGRVPTFRMGPRLIDIDILMYDDVQCAADGLTLPHPGLLERAFVLLPLLELDPELRHPVTGLRLADAVAGVDARGVRRIGGQALLPRTDGSPV